VIYDGNRRHVHTRGADIACETAKTVFPMKEKSSLDGVWIQGKGRAVGRMNSGDIPAEREHIWKFLYRKGLDKIEVIYYSNTDCRK